MITEGRTKLIGIDASFENVGITIYEPSTNRMQIETGDIFKCIAFLNKNCMLSKCVAVVENAALDSNLFGGFNIIKAAILKYVIYEIWKARPIANKDLRDMPEVAKMADIQSAFALSAKRAMNVGEAKAAGKLFVKMFRQKNVPTIQIAPSSRDRADKAKGDVRFMTMPTKTTAHQFKLITGSENTSNDDGRDSAMLVFGKSMAWAELLLQRNLEEKLTVSRKLKSTDGEALTVKNGKFTILDTTKK